uniref:4-hydroxybenzoyl-CoA thioesterase/acyl-CoA thioester hydrolase n=1 Tax=Candidatus Kentrum sp. FW TaxID=2126338 RepID=A0A450T0B3_9GAMM|nr:MAG: 4-hydroxybenzoyl-CoA thioesterase/acyl-CoA thioester hydrolase [Candidatus Kentron sp. FW]
MNASNGDFALRVRVYREDTDDLGVVYYANYLKFMGRARAEWLRSLGFDQVMWMREERVTFVIRKIAVDFLRPARLEDMVTVGARLQNFGQASLDFEQKVSSMTGELLCRADVKIACVNADSLAPRRIPQDLITRLTV